MTGHPYRANKITSGPRADDTQPDITDAAAIVQTINNLVDGTITPNGYHLPAAPLHGVTGQLNSMAGSFGQDMFKTQTYIFKQFEDMRPFSRCSTSAGRRINDNFCV
jgi:hypothetical protein